MISINKYQQLFLALAIVLANAITTYAQDQIADRQKADSIKVLETTNNFLAAFRNLEWDKFTEYFADDATAFFPPSARHPYRTNNKSEIMSIFKIVFENAHKRRSSAPYLDIDPKDIKIQMAAQLAVVSFTLSDPDMLSRRTLIWVKRNDKWVIIHLHASGISLTDK
ncbi:MAG: nuclear transport factor 2 family protein [Chitinophagaceae bacterium]